MIRVHFCVYIEPSPGRAVQQMRRNNQNAPNQPKKQINKTLAKQIKNKREGRRKRHQNK